MRRDLIKGIAVAGLMRRALAQSVSANAFGDSITVGVGAYPYGYADLVAQSKGWTLANYGMSGKQLADFFPSLYGGPLTITPTSNSFVLPGYNDMRLNGTDAAALLGFQRGIASMVAYLAIPASNLVLGNAAANSTGTWSATPVFPGMGVYSGTPGSSKTFYLTGKTVLVDILQFAGFTAGIHVSIDGMDYGVFEGHTFVPTNYWTPFSPWCIPFRGLSSGTHAVVLTATAGTGNAYINWVAGLNGSNPGPSVTVGNTLRMTAAGYVNPAAAPFNRGSDLAADLYSQAIIQTVRDFASDGLNVGYADTSAAYDPNTMVAADGVHPGPVTGPQAIAAVFLNSINQTTGIRGVH